MIQQFKGRTVVASTKARDFYTKNGYIIVPEVLSSQTVTQLRHLLHSEFCHYELGAVAPTRHLLGLEAIYSQIFKEQIIAVLRHILGEDFRYFPDLQVQRNAFGYPGWHTDSGSEGKADYLTHPEYRFVKCGIFFQDNIPEWAGGIDIVPKSHRYPRWLKHRRLVHSGKTALNILSRKINAHSVDIKAGDFVAFDSRLLHKSTWPSRFQPSQLRDGNFLDIPEAQAKYVLYWDAGSGVGADGFQLNSLRRGKLEQLNGAKSREFSDYLGLVWPDDYPADFIKIASGSGIKIASLSRESAAPFRKDRRHSAEQ